MKAEYKKGLVKPLSRPVGIRIRPTAVSPQPRELYATKGMEQRAKAICKQTFQLFNARRGWSFIRFLEITPDYGQQCVPGPNLADFKRKRAVLRPNICIIAREFGRTQRHIGILVEFIGLIVTWRFLRVISVGMSDVLTEIFSSLGDN